MRQGQQNRRGRGRNNNNNNNNNHSQNRKGGGQNPLSRSYESTGPDTKIRGTPAHIAEKYMQLARDAQSSGDPVLAENYLQHAEHYNRIIMTYREQQLQQNGSDPGLANGQIGRFRPAGLGDDEFGDEDGGEEFAAQPNQPSLRSGGDQQPRFDGQRFDERPQRHEHQRPPRDRDQRQFGDRGDRQDRGGERGDRPERFERAERPERADRPERTDRPERVERQDRGDRPDRGDRSERQGQDRGNAAEAPAQEASGGARRRERVPMAAHEQPEFLRRPVRRPRRDAASDTEAEDTAVIADENE